MIRRFLTVRRSLGCKTLSCHFCDDASENVGLFEQIKSMGSKYNYDIPYLNTLSKEMLVGRLVSLQREVDQYYTMFDSTNFDGRDKVRIPHPTPDKLIPQSAYNSHRKIAFRVLYLGWQYTSYVWKVDPMATGVPPSNSVERVFLEALQRQQLIPHIGSSKQMSRCGRTDRNVSALAQVVTISVRSNLKEGYGVWRRISEGDDISDSRGTLKSNLLYHEEEFSNKDTSSDEDELPYVQLLNEALPKDIRVLAWAPVARKFDPRKSCISRTYRYVFIRGELGIEAMNEAAQQFVGFHDFRNFSKKTATNAERGTKREVLSIEIKPVHKSPYHRSLDVCAATIKGKAFVHRQIRLMMSALRLVGLGAKPKSFISDALSVEKYPRGVGMSGAAPHNLALVDSEYCDDDIRWRWDQKALSSTAGMMAYNHNDASIKSAMLQHMLSELRGRITDHEGHQWVGYHLSSSAFSTFNKLESDENALTVDERKARTRQRDVERAIKKGKFSLAAKLVEKSTAEDRTDDESHEIQRAVNDEVATFVEKSSAQDQADEQSDAKGDDVSRQIIQP